MKSFKDLTSSLQLEAKATYCGRCGTVHVPPSQGGTCPALKKEETEIEEAHQVVAKTKEGETFRSAKYPTKKQAMDMHYKMAKSNKYAKVDTVKVQEDSKLDEAVKLGSKVTIHAPGKDYHGKVGSVGEIRHGAYKGAPKTYTVDYDHDESTGRAKSVQLDKRNIKQVKEEYMSSMEQYLAAIEGKADFRSGLEEKKLTPAEMKKREEVAQAMERENPGMDKSKKMAIATATAKRVAEEVEQIDELNKDTLQRYAMKATADHGHQNMARRNTTGDQQKEFARKEKNRQKGISRAYDRLHPQQEEADLDEEVKDFTKMSTSEINKHINIKLKNAMAGTLSKKSSDSLAAAQAEYKRRVNMKEETQPQGETDLENMHYCAKHVFSERFGEGFVVEGSHAEPDENGLIEWYDVDFGGTVRRVMIEKVKVMHAEYHMNHKRKKMSEEDKPHTVPKSEKEKDLAKLAHPKDKITHADVMVGRGVKKEEVDIDEEQINELSINKMMTYRSKATEKLGSDPAKDAKRKEGIRVSGMKVKAKLKNEEVELDEANSMQMASDIEAYAKKHGGIDKNDMMKVAGMLKRGDMKGAEKYTMSLDSDPRDFLLSKMGINEAKDLPFDAPYKKAEDEKKTDKSGAVHTPMSRARHLARQAMKKQVKENFDMDINDEEADQLIETVDFEQLAEISKATLGSYIKKAKGSAIGAAQVTGMGASMTGQKTQDKAEKKVQKRAAGINKAVDRLTSEEADLEEGMITYTDFMDKIKMHRKAGNKVVDDKYSDKKASYTTIDSEGQGRKVTHTTSGQKMENLGKVNGEDDEAAEAKPTEKRGRGRPAGSKSGVSKYNK